MGAGSDPILGTEVAGYRLDAAVGAGGMGVVYRAYDVRLKRTVAVKLLSPELAQLDGFRERFLLETEVAAGLEHPNVVPVHDAGDVDGRLYLVMRFVDGSDLRELLRTGPLAPERALSLCAQVASALDAAHDRGLVHRDVKPSNVLVDATGHAYLADFGLARSLAGAAGSPVGSLGTPTYVAPEQIRGEPVDGRADQYALACMLCECLAGTPPFRGGTDAALLFAHLNDEPQTPPGLEEVMSRALAKSPGDRYPSCSDFVADARRALGLVDHARSRRALAVVATAIAVVLVGGLLAAVLLRDDEPTAPPAAGRLVRIDAAGGRRDEPIPLNVVPSSVAVGPSGVWVADRTNDTVLRVDRDARAVVARADAHGKPADLAVAPGRVVVTDGPVEATLATIDPATGVQQGVFSLAPGTFLGSSSVALVGSTVWVATGDRRVGRLNVATGQLIDPLVIPQAPGERSYSIFSGIAGDARGVWVVGDPTERTAWRIDPGSGRLAAKIDLPFAPKDVAVGEGGVWISSQLDDTVSRIDPASNRITATVSVARGAAAVAVTGGSVWVAAAIAGAVSRIDPVTLDVETIEVDGYPRDVAADGNAVWVATGAEPRPVDDDRIAIGVLAACHGTYGFAAAASFAGAEMPLIDRGALLAGSSPADGVRRARVAGRDVELLFGCTDDSAESALAETRRLVELLGADLVIGSFRPNESIAIRDYARTRPAVTFLNGVGSGQELTLRNPSPNVFRFMTDAAQWQAGLGKYAYSTLGWRRVVTIGDIQPFMYVQTAGFVAEFCALGGEVVEQVWVPVGTSDLDPFVARVPRRGVDGFVINADPATVTAFLNGVPQLAGPLRGRVVASIGFTAPPLPETLGKRLDGVVIGAPDDTETQAAKRWVAAFDRVFPSLKGNEFFFAAFYRDSMEAALRGLEAVGGDLSGGQRRFRDALAALEIDFPTTGHIRLGERRQAIGSNYVVEFVVKPAGIGFRTVAVARDVEQTFNGYFRPDGPPPTTHEIACREGNAPPWAR